MISGEAGISRKLIVSGLIAQAGSQGYIYIINLIFIILLARILGDYLYGTYQLAIGYSGIFGILIDLGFSALAVRDIAKDRNYYHKYLTNMILIKIILSSLYYVIIAFVINYIYHDFRLTLISILISIEFVLGNIVMLIYVSINAFKKYELSALLMSINRTIVVSLSIFGIYIYHSLTISIIGMIIGEMISYIICIVVINSKLAMIQFNIDLVYWKKIFIYALPFTSIIIINSIYSYSSSIIISIFYDINFVAWFSAAQRIIAITFFIPAILNSILLPILSELFSNNRIRFFQTYNESIRYLWFSSFGILLIILINAKYIIEILFGTQFLNSTLYLLVLSSTLPLNWITYTGISAFVASGNEIKSRNIYLIRLLVFGGTFVSLLSINPMIGILLAFIISDLISFIYTIYHNNILFDNTKRIIIILIKISIIFGLSLISIVVLGLIPIIAQFQYSFLIYTIVAMSIFTLVSNIFGVIQYEDIKCNFIAIKRIFF